MNFLFCCPAATGCHGSRVNIDTCHVPLDKVTLQTTEDPLLEVEHEPFFEVDPFVATME